MKNFILSILYRLFLLLLFTLLFFRKVEQEISDCKGENNILQWNKLCQDVLRTSYGMNLMNLLNHILKRRLKLLNSEENGFQNSVIFDGCQLGRYHAIFDVLKVKEITSNLCCDFKKLKMDEECEGLSYLE